MTLPAFLARFALAGVLTLAVAATAEAHAFLDHASPAAGSTVAAAPALVRIWFTEGVEPAFSRISVTDRNGRPVEDGKAETGDGDKRILQIAVAKLPPGTYTVVWQVTSVDTHRTNGRFTFTVAAG